MRRILPVACLLALLTPAFPIGLQAGPQAAAGPAAHAAQSPPEARQFLDLFGRLYSAVRYEAQKAEWAASTDVTDEHVGGRIAAGKALASLAGSPAVIQTARQLLQQPEKLSALDARQLQKILLDAAEAPGTVPEVVAKRVEAEARQSSILDSFQFCLDRQGEKW